MKKLKALLLPLSIVASMLAIPNVASACTLDQSHCKTTACMRAEYEKYMWCLNPGGPKKSTGPRKPSSAVPN